MKAFHVLAILTIATSLTFSGFASNQGPQSSQGDPYIATPYMELFHMQTQRMIFEHFTEVLQEEGLSYLLDEYPLKPESPSWLKTCAARLWGAGKYGASYLPIEPCWTGKQPTEADVERPQTSEDLNAALIVDFIARKHKAALAPSKERCGGLLLQCLSLGALLPCSTACPSLAFAGGIAGFVMVEEFNRTMISGYLDYQRIARYQGIDPWMLYEAYYVSRKRFLPEALWVPIDTKFAMARSNPFTQAKSTEYLDIALNLPSQKAMIGQKSRSEEDPELWLQRALEPRAQKIDEFFTDYEDSPEKEEVVGVFKEAMRLQLEASIDPNQAVHNKHRVLFLRGPGGLGKTRFINEFAKILYGDKEGPSRLISVNLAGKDLGEIVGSNEGDKSKPGVLLSALTKRVKGAEGRRYINEMLFVDEAAGILTDASLKEPFKAILENTYGKFESEYLGGYSIHLKDYLIVAAGNITKEEISDQAFADRFVMLDFPWPKKSVLEYYMASLIHKRLQLPVPSKTGVIDFRAIQGLEASHQKTIEALLQKPKLTFRDIDNKTASFLPLLPFRAKK